MLYFLVADYTPVTQTSDDVSTDAVSDMESIYLDVEESMEESREDSSCVMNINNSMDISTDTIYSCNSYISTTSSKLNIKTRTQKLSELHHLSVVNHQTMMQASRAIEFCRNSKKYISTPYYIEYERVLLLSSKYLLKYWIKHKNYKEISITMTLHIIVKEI